MNQKKYCSLYLVRHGETDWNVKGLLQGQKDIPLNKTGIKQAKELGKMLKNISFKAVFSSDLLRAKKTAEMVVLEKKIIVQTTKALRERRYGRFEGAKFKEDKEYQEMLKKFMILSEKEKFSQKPFSEAESDEDLMRRLIPFLREIAVAYPQKNILIVTHGGVMRAFLKHLGFGDDKTLPAGCIKNTAYVKLLCDGTDFFIKETFGIKKTPPAYTTDII